MKQKNDSFREFGKTIAPYFIAIWAFCMLIFWILDSILPAGTVPEMPEINLSNARPCLGFEQDAVERFEVGESQYVCAEMETEEPHVFLELYVFTSDKKRQVDVSGGTFSPGSILFYMESLPPGRYIAFIRWAKTDLANFEFEVVEKDSQ